jgi:hypothetical protein
LTKKSAGAKLLSATKEDSRVKAGWSQGDPMNLDRTNGGRRQP